MDQYPDLYPIQTPNFGMKHMIYQVLYKSLFI